MVSFVHFSDHLKSDSGSLLVIHLHAFHSFISEILKYMYLFVFDSFRHALMSFNLFQTLLPSHSPLLPETFLLCISTVFSHLSCV